MPSSGYVSGRIKKKKEKKKGEIIYKLQTQPKEEKGVTYSP